MNQILVILFSMFLGLNVFAAASDYGVEIGFRSQSADTASTTETTKAGVGYQMGASGSFQLGGALNLRTGLMYVERPIKLAAVSTTDTADVRLTYFDVPVTLSYKFEDYASVYAGVALSLNLSNTISGTGYLAASKITNAKSMLVPITFGAAFRFAPQMGVNLFFETIPGDLADNYKNYRAVGANFLFYFD